MRAHCLALLFSTAWASAFAQAQDSAGNAAPELGRLFFSPAERVQLEGERSRPRTARAPDGPARVTVNGLISRPGRPPLPVVNGRVLSPGDNLSGLKITGQPDGRVRIAAADGTVRLARPGQSVDLTTGETAELFDLPDRRRAAAREATLPVPFGSGSAEVRAEPPAKHKVVKGKRPRKAHAKRPKSAPTAPHKAKTAPTVVQPVAPPAAPAPGIPRPPAAPPAPIVRP